MTPMKLHKLLYYCQGWHLAWYGRPLFVDRIEAWRHGPVVPAVYDQPWGRGSAAIADPGGSIDLPAAARAAVEQVWSHYNRYSACGLRDKTHAEPPWRDHYSPDANARCSAVIPTSDMATFFGGEFRRRTGDTPGAAAEAEANAVAGRAVRLDDLIEELGR